MFSIRTSRRSVRRRLAAGLGALATAAAVLIPITAASAATGISVDFSANLGVPAYHASGTLYGMTPDGSNPPSQFYTGIKWHFERAGGAQLNNGGYATSLADYQTRFASTLAQYRRTVALGGTFVILPHDLWGADGTTSQAFPGDNGDWSTFTNFVNQLIGDVRANGMNPEWDLWNEPDLGIFWNAPQSQYLEMWRRFYQAVRSAFPNAVIVGPSTSSQPSTGNGWWSTYLDYARTNNVVPNIFSWHDESGDPAVDKPNADAALSAHGISSHPYQINEYAGPSEQNPGAGGWYISRLERANIDGLRGNWAGGLGLHDDEAGLLQDNGGGQYQPLGEWYTYQFYASMTGTRVGVTPAGDLDGVATKDTGNAKVLLGNHGGTTGAVTVNLGRLDTTSIVNNGQVRAVVQVTAFNGGAPSGGPVTVSDQNIAVSGNSATVTFNWNNPQDGYSITLLPPTGGGSGGGGQSGEIVGAQSGRCVDINNFATTNGTQAQLWDCNAGTNQIFTHTTGNQLTVYGNKCLDTSNGATSAGTAVVIWDCDNTASQQWITNASGTITNAQSGLCMDATGRGTSNGTKVIIWTCNGQTNQQWTMH